MNIYNHLEFHINSKPSISLFYLIIILILIPYDLIWMIFRESNYSQ